MRRLSTLVIGLAFSAATFAGGVAGDSIPKFEDYSVNVPVIKKIVLPKTQDSDFRYEIKAVKTPNFAGHYIVVSLGCGGGSACERPQIVDVLTGKSIEAPWAVGWNMDVKTQVNSRLFVLSTEGKVQYYVFNGKKLQLIKEIEQSPN